MFAVLMMFIIIEENGGEAAGIYFSCKKPGSHHGGEKRAVYSLECCDVADYRWQKEQMHVLPSRLRLFCI
ncbi:MAG: hypothetical protein ACQEUS_12845 [Bacillota bacterium]